MYYEPDQPCCHGGLWDIKGRLLWLTLGINCCRIFYVSISKESAQMMNEFQLGSPKPPFDSYTSVLSLGTRGL